MAGKPVVTTGREDNDTKLKHERTRVRRQGPRNKGVRENCPSKKMGRVSREKKKNAAAALDNKKVKCKIN